MRPRKPFLLVASMVLSVVATAGDETTGSADFIYNQASLTGVKPWTSGNFQNDPNEFQFAIIGDRTGGANVHETFKIAMGQLNLLQPEFVINVGDVIEGYSDEKDELNAEWDGVDAMLDTLKMPYFRTPGNHDIANKTAQQVWRERYGATHYYFVYRDTLFVILDSEDDSRPSPPPEMKEKIELYNRLQTEDPESAQKMLAEFMSDEAVIAGLSKPVEFREDQLAFVESTLEKFPNVRWTFLFLHEPAWENPSESFKSIQASLKGRAHTFFAGHLHYYDYDLIDGTEYITMGPTGASFHHEGPGNVDHLTWVTMTEEGPEIANVALKGIFDRRGLDPAMFGAYDRKGTVPKESDEGKPEEN